MSEQQGTQATGKQRGLKSPPVTPGTLAGLEMAAESSLGIERSSTDQVIMVQLTNLSLFNEYGRNHEHIAEPQDEGSKRKRDKVLLPRRLQCREERRPAQVKEQ